MNYEKRTISGKVPGLKKHSNYHRIVASIMLAMLFIGIIPIPSACAASGTDQNIKWKVTNKVLTISGEGAIPDYWTRFGPDTPWGGQDYNEVVIEEGITATSKGLFYAGSLAAENLTKVTLPESLTTIALYTFYGQANLKICKLPSQLKIIEDSAFQYCEFESVEIPKGTWSIGERAFFNNTSLEKVTLPDNALCVLGDEAFASCNIKSLHIPRGVYMGSAFSGNENLKTITVAEDHEYTVIDGVLYRNNGATLVLYPAGRSGSKFTVPGTVTKIEGGAFNENKLSKITIPASVTSIGQSAFSCSKNLEKIALPSGISVLPDFAFYKCEKLTELEIPEGVVSIGKYALDECPKLTSVKLPKSLKSIGEGAFEEGGLKDIYYSGRQSDRKKIEVDKWNFMLDKVKWHYSDSSPKETITASDGIYALNYETKTATLIRPAKKTLKKLTVPETIKVDGENFKVTGIKDEACEGMKNLKKVTIGKNVEQIGQKAFYNCKDLETLTISTTSLGDNSIGKEAFKGTPKTMTVKCPKKKLDEYKSLLIKAGINEKAKFTKK